VAVGVAFAALAAAGAAPAHGGRVHKSDLAYKGAFRLPVPVNDRKTFAYGGTALAYDAARDGLFAVGHDWYQLTAEVSVPHPVRAARLGRLRRARYLQGFTDATNGRIDDTGQSGNKIGGQLVHRDRLFGTAYVYYDASASQRVSHWARPSKDLEQGRARGLFRVGRVGAGFVSGYMAEVPRRWRRALGGPALTGNCCIPIVSRTSYGPAVSAFDPARLGKVSPVPAQPLVHYPQAHTTLGAWDASWNPKRGILFNGGSSIRGVVFPRRTRSVLFLGTQGTGPFCYGEGTDERELAGQPTPDGSEWCYDPADSSKGTHAYPYVPMVWAYDARRLRAVRRGRARPWQVRPYATWRLRLPFGSSRIGGAAYDSRRGRLFVSQQNADGTQPLIHVFAVR
jgi:hypothetical protein